MCQHRKRRVTARRSTPCASCNPGAYIDSLISQLSVLKSQVAQAVGPTDREETPAYSRWVRIFREWERADCTITMFCKRQRISEPSFYLWRRRIVI